MKILTILIFLVSSCSAETKVEVKAKKPTKLTYNGTKPRVQNPLSPKDTLTHLQMPKGFEAILFASEPDIINPIAFSWDEKGRLWVIQSFDYPHKLKAKVGGDKITICEDTDNDGRADKFIDFAINQKISTGITIVKGGAIIAQADKLVFLEDTNGDDKYDKKHILFTGFGTRDTHAGPSNLTYGIDNKIWGAVGYSAVKYKENGKKVLFQTGIYHIDKNGKNFEPIGNYNNNTWGLGLTEDFEIFGSTANNNHACYTGIPLPYYSYFGNNYSNQNRAISTKFIQGHYEINPVTKDPLQQVDVRGGYTAASGANFYTARNFPQKYWNQMFVNEPTGHLVHFAKIIEDGAGYKEQDAGHLLAATDNWVAPVYSATGPDGNFWVADWYNPVIQHNPDKRGMENQIWNSIKGAGNAHINSKRNYLHGRIYIIRYQGKKINHIKNINPNSDKELINALKSDNMFWRLTAQRLIVENNKTQLIPQLYKLITNSTADKINFNGTALHALWTLHGLGQLNGSNPQANQIAYDALKNSSPAVRKAAASVLPKTQQTVEQLISSNIFNDKNLHTRLKVLLVASQMPRSKTLDNAIQQANKNNQNDQWLKAAYNVYLKIIPPKKKSKKFSPQITLKLNVKKTEMAFEQKTLEVLSKQRVRIIFSNPQEMPHNVIFIKGSIDEFGKTVDDMLLTNNKAAQLDYIPPNSKVIIAASKILQTGKTVKIDFIAPNTPGRYPFVCTFPGHWRIMQGVLIVKNSKEIEYKANNPKAKKIHIFGGGSSHNFFKTFGEIDGQIINNNKLNYVFYTEDENRLNLAKADVLMLTNNKPFNKTTRDQIFSRINQGMGLMINHASTWYNWKNWQKYNQKLVGGGSKGHEKLQNFEVIIKQPNHPIMKGISKKFIIFDELYFWKKDPKAKIEILAIGRGIKSKKEFPVIWIVKHPKAKVIGNTLGHDHRAHEQKDYQKIIINSVKWTKQK